MKLNNVHKAIIIWLASFLLVSISSEFKKPTLSVLGFLTGCAATVFIKDQLGMPIPSTPSEKVEAPAPGPKKLEAPKHTPQPAQTNPKVNNSQWDEICKEAEEEAESGAAFLKALVEPIGLWNPISIGKALPIGIVKTLDGTMFHKGTQVPTDLQIHIGLSSPIEWKQAAKWLKDMKFLGFKTSLDSKGYTYSPHVKISLPKDGGGEVVTLSISIEGAFTE
jgi:hypothetical protein